ncbi:hypothetical protein TCAL_14221 [Tigriopus californicus]|uniref:Serpin domain-containing protein n=2 Tax=Tigriopus californicus TaxID=6832 RepID=A0A553NSW2_TIGCA|nr:hypothetical protein TCAL_14221 [Tigriopus californicus]
MKALVFATVILGLSHALPQNRLPSVVDSSAFIGSMAKFAETLYAKLETEENAVFSPFSLHMALTMLSSAASKESPTQTELLSLLGELQNIEHLESKYGKLITEYNGLNDTFLFGNKVWLSSDFKIKPSYNDTIGMLLNGSVEVLPANLNEAVARINNWASDVTKGKIPKLFDSLSQDTRAVLTNAIYFKDAWTIPFDEYEGEPTFTLIDGKTIGASDGLKMMSRTSYEFGRTKFTLEGLKNVEFQAVTIPYKAMFGDRFEMVIVMPTGPQNAIQFLDQAIKTNVNRFGDTNGGNWFLDKLFKELGKSGVHSEEINLVMPEFQVASKFSVAGALKQLGVQGIFNDGEFDSISDEPLKVSDIIHRAIIEVDKEGTVGAAATGIELVPLSGAFLEPELLIINQPFVFLIRDIKENVILFYGKVINPIS